MTGGRPEPKRQLQRVPPHDTQTEKHLLGAALLNRDAAAMVADLGGDVFYVACHNTIAAAIRTLALESKPVEAGTVAAHLRSIGQLDGVQGDGAVGPAYLLTLVAGVPASTSAHIYAGFVTQYHRQRQMLLLAGGVADAVYSGVSTAGLVAEMVATTEAGLIGRDSSWDLVNLAATLAGEDGDDHPCFLHRTDGVPILYPGKVHAFNAESETGKSMLAIYACAERLRAGEHVGYIDFEDSPRGVIDRLLGFGVPAAAALERFHYIRPDDPIDAGAKLRVQEMLRVFPVTLVVIDGVAEALALSGWDENAASDIATFYNTLPRAITRAGVTVILIDHLVKDKDKQGNDARGSGAKRAGIDGAAFKLETITPFVRGGHGRAKILLTKDRPGWVRPSVTGRVIAEMHLSSDDETGGLTCELRPPVPSSDEAGHFQPTGYMERVSKAMEGSTVAVSKAWIEREVGGNRQHVRTAITRLEAEGYVRIDRQGQALLHSLTRPYRELSHREEDF